MATNYRDNTALTDAQKASLVGLATAIRTKMYGKDVREAIASAIELVGQPEVNNYFTPKGVVANLAALKNTYPNGTDGIWITKDDGYWNYWDGNSWQKGNAYQAPKLAKNSVGVNQIEHVSFEQINDSNAEISNTLCTEDVSSSAVENNLIIAFSKTNSSTTNRAAFVPVKKILDGDLHLVFDLDAAQMSASFNQEIYLSKDGSTLDKQVSLITVNINAVEHFNIKISANDIASMDTDSFYVAFVADQIGTIVLNNFSVNKSGDVPGSLSEELTDLKTLIDNKKLNYSDVVDNLADLENAKSTSGVSFDGTTADFKIENSSGKLQALFVPINAANRNDLVLNLNLTELDVPNTQGSLQVYLANSNGDLIEVLGTLSMTENMSLTVKLKKADYNQIGSNFEVALILNNFTGRVRIDNFLVNDDGMNHNLLADLESTNDLIKNKTIAFDHAVNNFADFSNVQSTSGISFTGLTDDSGELSISTLHSAASSQFLTIFCNAKNPELIHHATMKITPKNVSADWTQQVYLTDENNNLVKMLSLFNATKNNSTSITFDIDYSSAEFGIALISNTLGIFDVELCVNDVDGVNTDLTGLSKQLGSNYQSKEISIANINFANLTSQTVSGIAFACANDTVDFDNGILKKIYAYVSKAGNYNFAVGQLDQNNLIVSEIDFSLSLSAGFNSIDVSSKNIAVNSASRVFMDMSNATLYAGTNAILIQTSDDTINDGTYRGMILHSTTGTLPFGFLAESKSLTDRLSSVEKSVSSNAASIKALNHTLTVVSSSGIKFKLAVDDSGNLTAKNATPSKVRVFGNSLTANPEGFGLAASDDKHDYYYLVSQYILSKNSSADISRHGVGSWEGSTTTADRQTQFDTAFKPYLSADTDLVILQCMENVGSVAAKQTLENDSKELIRNIKAIATSAEIIWVYGWWGDSTIFKPAKDACDAYGAVPININDIGTQSSMQSYVGQTRTLTDGTVRTIKDIEASHPGDAGHAAIANRIISNFDF